MKTPKLVGASVLLFACLVEPAWPLPQQGGSQSGASHPSATAPVQEFLNRSAQSNQPAEILAAADSAISIAEQSSDHEGLALAYRIRAKTIESSDHRSEAIDIWRRAADEFAKAGDTPGQIECLSSAGVLLLKSDPLEAEGLFEAAISAGKSEKSPSVELARAWYAAGNLIMNLKQIVPARKFYAAALDLLEALAPGSVDEALVYEGLGRVSLEARDDPKTALDFFERSRQIAEKIDPDSVLVARNYYRIGNVYMLKTEFPEAIHNFERGLKISDTLKQSPANDRLLAGLLNSLGIIADKTGNYSDARKYFERVYAIKKKYPEDLDTALVVLNLGNIAKDSGDLGAAYTAYTEALAIENRLAPDTPQLAGTLFSLGTLADMQGDYDSANRYLRQAFEIQQKVAPSSQYLAFVLNGLGDVALHEGDLAKATEYRKEELEIHRRLAPGGLDEAGTLSALGDIKAREGDFKAASQYEHEALAISEKLSPKGEATISPLQNLGKIETDQRRYDSAREFYQRALEIQQSNPVKPLDMARTLQGLGDVAAATGRFKEADSYDARAIALLETTLGPDHPDVARELNRMAIIQLHTDGADKSFDTALRAEAIGSAHLRLTIQGLSERQALLYASDRPVSLDLLLSLLAQKLYADPQSVQQTWSAVIRSRAMVLDEMAERHRAVIVGSDPGLLELANKLASAKKRLANLSVHTNQDYSPEVYRSLLDRTGSEIEEVERTLSQRSRAFREKTLHEQVGLPEVSSVLAQGAALVAYVRYNRIDLERMGSSSVPSYAAFVLPAQGSAPSFVSLGGAQTIENLWSDWNKEINREAHTTLPDGNSEIRYRHAATALRKAIWDPVAAKLGKAADVFIVSDGVLHLLNLDSLPAGGKRYLADDPMLFHYASAERDLTVIPSSHGMGMLAIGNPDFNWTISNPKTARNYRGSEESIVPGGQSSSFRGSRSACKSFSSLRFTPLPGSGHEAEEISNLWKNTALHTGSKDDTSITLTGHDASELEFRQFSPGRRILHLATHTFFLGGACNSILQTDEALGNEHGLSTAENPLLLSGLAFAGANHRNDPDQDGIITAEEIAVMDLEGVDLAVLSACDTGRGQIRAGEGVFGLRRAFQIAGANTVVMSLWPVDDEMTRKWMLSMYHGWLVDRKNSAAAVRLADLQILNQRRTKHLSTHPFYWAAFIASGNRD